MNVVQDQSKACKRRRYVKEQGRRVRVRLWLAMERNRKMKNEFWKKFEETGYVKDYLDYVQVKMETVDKEGAKQDESGNGDGNRFIGDADWRI